jgi:hypothetical protein
MTGRGDARTFQALRRFAMPKLSLLWATLLASALGMTVLTAAPAPFYPKDNEAVTVTESYLVGTWEVVCGPYRSVVTFHRDGRYFGRRDGREYAGKWRVLWGGLFIEESVVGEETRYKFRVVLFVASGRQQFVASLLSQSQLVSMGKDGPKDTFFRRLREPSRNGRR